jgi:hypothetical protein
MRANPGGEIASTDVVGRDELIARLWQVLELRSIVLTAERRMGKTTVIKKMLAEPPAGKLAIYRDLESIHTLLEFVESVLRDVETYLSRTQRVAVRSRQILTRISGCEIGGMVKVPDVAAPHWKVLLTTTLEDLLEYQDRMVVLLWDELPMMLHNIKAREGDGAAEELLNTLRTIRQMQSGVRMVFTGSIGLHNVISGLKLGGYANDPTNDMEAVEVPPLSPEDGSRLAYELLRGESLLCEAPLSVARDISDAVDGIPFYIHRLIDQIGERRGPATLEQVHKELACALKDPQDRWHFRHFRERINTYYSSENIPTALAILDTVALSAEPLPYAEIFDRIPNPKDREVVRDVLVNLQRDHYLQRDDQGRYHFTFSLISQWWAFDRGL